MKFLLYYMYVYIQTKVFSMLQHRSCHRNVVFQYVQEKQHNYKESGSGKSIHGGKQPETTIDIQCNSFITQSQLGKNSTHFWGNSTVAKNF